MKPRISITDPSFRYTPAVQTDIAATFRRVRMEKGTKRLKAVWRTMKARCDNPKVKSYPIYGGRGIRVCPRWQSFENFLADMGVCERGMTLDRINNDGNYEPANCRWTTRQEQNKNRRDNRRYHFNGQTLLLSEWEAKTGISEDTLRVRLSIYGWTPERAFTEPLHKNHGRCDESELSRPRPKLVRKSV